MKITENKVVSLVYELEVDGQKVDFCTPEKPLEYIHGTGQLLKKFEENIEGLKAGEEFSFTLTPEEGYGEPEEEKIIDLPKEVFAVNGEIQNDLLIPGNTIQMMNNMGGIIPGKVLEVTEDIVKMDLNHPMAGKTLNFSGLILTVRGATEQELDEGLYREYAGGCSGCSSQGSCGGSCSDDDHDCDSCQ